MKDIILHGDVYACLDNITSSISVAITSPPYWKQRDYGFSGQIGQEETYTEYIGRLVSIFHKLKQKLRSNGIFFLNIGDKYKSQYGKSRLLQIPYQLAYHMVKDGWYLEDIIIWYKPNHMPSPARDRFTNTYEPVLVFSKSKNNIYKNDLPNVIKIPLQQTPYKHTAIFPEKLIMEMLNRVNLKDDDLILDPFAGTGTVAFVVKNIRTGLFPKKIYSIMIEKGNQFIDVIQKRVGIKDVIKVNDFPYHWDPPQSEKIPDITPLEIMSDQNGEIFIAQNSQQFLSVINAMMSSKFINFHREDALYFFGVKNWSLEDLFYSSQIYSEDYVLRNMIIISNDLRWYPIFMFARDTTRFAYKFYLDRIRIKTKIEENRDWSKQNFIGIRVSDSSGKETRRGWIEKIIKRYDDNFPKIVVVKWNGNASNEFVLHPKNDEFIMEGIIFQCPTCQSIIEEPYDPIEGSICSTCNNKIWEDLENICLINEPKEILDIYKALKKEKYVGKILEIKQFEEKKKITNSKFANLKRINWGASPGARKLMLGEYFIKTRLYRMDQPLVAQYLTILRKSKKMSIKDIIDKFPKHYRHTVGHWFRKDFGGSIPVIEDVKTLKEILDVKNYLFNILERTALKFQTVKTSVKGKNPGDFIEDIDQVKIKNYLTKLYLPSQ